MKEKKKTQSPDELNDVNVSCSSLTHYMVVHNSMKSLTISTRLLYVLYEGNKNKFHHDHDIFFSITNPT